MHEHEPRAPRPPSARATGRLRALASSKGQEARAPAASAQLASANPAAVYLASLAPGSRRAMHQALRLCGELLAPGVPFEQLPWVEVRRGQMQAVRTHLIENYATATANKVLCALRGVVREAIEMGLLPADEGARSLSVSSVRGERPPAGRALSAGEMRALFSLCQRPTAAAARDAAALALLYGAGLRRAELVGLRLEDWRREEGVVAVRGKGSKLRRVPLPQGAQQALSAWLAHRGEALGPLLLPVSSGGRVLAHRPLSTQAVYHLLRRLGARAGLAPFSPHDLRRSYIGELLATGADLCLVQRLVGHQSPTTTARYDRRPEAAGQRAAERLFVPFSLP